MCRFILKWLCVFDVVHVGVVPDRGDDGARLCNDRRDQSVLVRFHGRPQPGRQDRHDLPTVLGAAQLAVSLRLRHESRQKCSVRCGKY